MYNFILKHTVRYSQNSYHDKFYVEYVGQNDALEKVLENYFEQTY